MQFEGVKVLTREMIKIDVVQIIPREEIRGAKLGII